MVLTVKNIVKLWNSFAADHEYIVMLLQAAGIFFGAALTHFITNKLMNYFPLIYFKYHKRANQFLVNFILKSIRKPVIVLIWLAAVMIGIHVFYDKPSEALNVAVSIVVITWLLFRLLNQSEKYLINFVYRGEQTSFRQSKTTIIAIGKLLKIVLLLTVILWIMDYRGINITSIVAVGGASTVVLGIAAKELLANFFGGMMVFMDRQFMVGDFIRSPDQEISGTVEYIGWRVTRIRTLDSSALYVPNSVFLTVSVDNGSRRYNRVIKEVIRFKYKDLDKINGVVTELTEMLKNHPDIDQEQMYFVGINKFNYTAVDCLLWCFTKAIEIDEHLRIQHDVLYKISEILANHDIELVFSLIDPPNNSA
jgi:MscS family membrane protein